ncbi:MAG: DNA-binding Lrp family transcriptional regulator [Patescibacteria group bacterium]|jgi:DNA-binding Lrp family transcriptional regulator
MKEKLKKLIFEYTSNARITTKELGKRIYSSQQSASYLISTLKEKGMIEKETVIIDAVKLGYINTIIGFNYNKLSISLKKRVLSHLDSIPEVIAIEESSEGFDLLIEFCTKTLAGLDKIHMQILNEFKEQLNTVFIFPIITTYKFPRKYLKKEKIIKTKILSGDRILKKISENESKIISELIKDPVKKTYEIEETTGINRKSITRIIKDLEKKFIIKGYGAIFNHNKLGIRRNIVFLRFSSSGLEEIESFIEYAKEQKNIIEMTKLIGSSQVMIKIEDLKEIELIKEIRAHFSIQSYMTFKSEKVHKKQYLPNNFMQQ